MNDAPSNLSRVSGSSPDVSILLPAQAHDSKQAADGEVTADDAPVNDALREPITSRAFVCICGRPIFFRNSICLACSRPLGYWPERDAMLPLAPAETEGWWREAGKPATAPHFRRCDNLTTASACNWLVLEKDVVPGAEVHCISCRLTRQIPDLSIEENAQLWGRAEFVKRRLVSSLIGLRLPVTSKVDDPTNGLAFDFLRAQPNGDPVITGHADGVITLDVAEADSSIVEARRKALHEPYRTMLGHMRHESGHYYWQRLVAQGDMLEAFRERFGDERVDYDDALKRYYANGPAVNWGQKYVSAYASSHPWEDWAETWAHFMHMRDTMDTAISFGLGREQINLTYEKFDLPESARQQDPDFDRFLELVDAWMRLTGALNELARSMGMLDFYPFALSFEVVQKLYFIERLIQKSARAV